jgi:hypothetical protein
MNPADAKWKVLEVHSSSRTNLGWLACREIFTKEELSGRTCRGVINKGVVKKLPLSLEKLLQFKQIALYQCPLKPQEDEYHAWRACEKVIDTYLRTCPQYKAVINSDQTS